MDKNGGTMLVKRGRMNINAAPLLYATLFMQGPPLYFAVRS